MNHTSYKIDLPANAKVVVFYNGIKALNIRGFFWLWRQIFMGEINSVKQAPGCIEAKPAICTPTEVVIVSYWQDEQSLMAFFHSPLHRQMMKNTMNIIAADKNAIALFNETYSPLRSGMYFNKPQGLAKIYPAIAKSKALAK